MIIKEMADGRFVGIAAIEITSFPAFSSYPEQPEMVFLQNREAFLRLIREFHRLSVQKTACIELLWITENTHPGDIESKSMDSSECFSCLN